MNALKSHIFSIKDSIEFNKIALEIFNHQSQENEVYKDYINLSGINPLMIQRIEAIPFLPIQFYKTKIVSSNSSIVPQKIFTSSGTTGMETSKHYVNDLKIYEKSFISCFELFYGNPNEFVFFALLPSYIERQGSSLIYMMEKLISLSENQSSGFYLNNYDALIKEVDIIKKTNKKIIVLGVSFALLELAENYHLDWSHIIVIETGGMKGKRNEMIKEEFYAILKSKLNVSEIHSEYGMTELLSQAYSKANGKFFTPPWMKVIISDATDHKEFLGPAKTGLINVIDLANIDSCSFISTNDLGRINVDGSFEVLGRQDNSDLRGCNLLAIN